MSIKLKLLYIILTLASLLSIVGWMGYKVSNNLKASFNKISGPVLSLSDAVTSGSQAINNQSIYVEKALRIGIHTSQEKIKSLNNDGEAAYLALSNTALLDPHTIQKLRADMDKYITARNNLLEKNNWFLSIAPKLDKNIENFNYVLNRVELIVSQNMLTRDINSEEGDKNQDNDESKYMDEDVVNANTQAQFVLLTRLYLYNRFLNDSKNKEILNKIKISWEDLEYAIETIVENLNGDKPLRGDVFPGITHKQALVKLLKTHKKLLNASIINYTQLLSALELYKNAAKQLEQQNLQLNKLVHDKVINEKNSTKKAFKTGYQYILLTIGLGLILCIPIYIFSVRTITKPVLKVANQLNDIAQGEGDLTVKLEETGGNELKQLAIGFNAFTEKLNQSILNIKNSTHSLNSTAIQITSVGNATENSVANQHQQIDILATTIAQLTQKIDEIAIQTEQAHKDTLTIDNEAVKGQDIVMSTINSIEQVESEVNQVAQVISLLNQDTVNISEILDVIRTISEQTNLLALNAAIEAARAGESGRGFAVVADEVRGLATRTNNSIIEIEEKIDHLQNTSNSALIAMQQASQLTKDTVIPAQTAGNSLKNITHLIEGITQSISHIASSSREQSNGANEIKQSTEQIREAATSSSFSAKQLSESTADLVAIATNLSNLAAEYKTEDELQSDDKNEKTEIIDEKDIDDAFF